MVSDALYKILGKKVEVTIVDDDNIIEGMFIESDNIGFTIRGKDDDDNEFLGFYPFRQLIAMKAILTVTPNPKKQESGLEIEDSDDMAERKQLKELESAVAVLGKDYEVDYSEGTVTISDGDGENVIEGDVDGLTVYYEKAFEVSKKIALIIGAKKITRDYQEE